jgi:hypothetical protein
METEIEPDAKMEMAYKMVPPVLRVDQLRVLDLLLALGGLATKDFGLL